MTAKDTIFLHIGMHKTATTAIQLSLQKYNDGTTRYARLGRPNHSIPLVTLFSRGKTLNSRHARLKSDREVGRDLRKRTEQTLLAELNSPERNLILSGEGLAGLPRSGVQALHDFLTPHCRQIRLLAYVRDPISFASSALQQRIKGGSTRFQVPAPFYRRRFAKFLKVFGADAMEFVRFAPDAFCENDIIADFCHRVGIPRQNAAEESNSSLSASSVSLLLAWNRGGALRTQAHGRSSRAPAPVLRALEQNFPGRFRLDSHLVGQHVNLKDCEWMERKAGFALMGPDAAPLKDLLSAAGTETQSNGIPSEDALETLAREAVPQLRPLLEDAGTPLADDASPAQIMDALFLALCPRTGAA
jgi:hypothetical protein